MDGQQFQAFMARVPEHYKTVSTEPHVFEPLKRFRNRGRCASCLVHESIHDTGWWNPARPMYDKSEAIL